MSPWPPLPGGLAAGVSRVTEGRTCHARLYESLGGDLPAGPAVPCSAALRWHSPVAVPAGVPEAGPRPLPARREDAGGRAGHGFGATWLSLRGKRAEGIDSSPALVNNEAAAIGRAGGFTGLLSTNHSERPEDGRRQTANELAGATDKLGAGDGSLARSCGIGLYGIGTRA